MTATRDCATCAERTGTKRYCALTRCYCGHDDCPAFASYIDPAALPIVDAPAPKRRHSSSWDDREAATWIDKL